MYDHGKLHVHCECAEVEADPQYKLCHAPRATNCENKMCHLLSKIIKSTLFNYNTIVLLYKLSSCKNPVS